MFRIPRQNHTNHKNLIISLQNHENQEIHIIQTQNHKNHANSIIPLQNHESHEVFKIQRQHMKKMKCNNFTPE